jgi:DNA-binding IclR family transcriptional regulator
VHPVHDERALDLLSALDARERVGVRELLSTAGCCESDLHGLLAELRAAGLVAETTAASERGYRTTRAGSEALARFRDE